MQRRSFLKTVGVGTWAGVGFVLGDTGRRSFAAEPTVGNPDLVAVKNGEPEALFDRGIEALGGMPRMGVVWDRGEWHANDLHQCIAEFATYRKPDLNVVDAYNVLLRHGPRGVSAADVSNMRSQLLSTDLVTADAAVAKLFGLEPDAVDYIRIAGELGVGRKDLEHLAIRRIAL